MTMRFWERGSGGMAVTVFSVFLLLAAPPSLRAEPEMTDQAIADKIDDELLQDPGVVAAKVGASVTDGIATLTGQVSNLLAKERAGKIASTVKGVRSVVNRIRVQPPEDREDNEIARDIESALLTDPATESYELAVAVDGGTASLTGNVQSYRERELAIRAAKGVRGVTDVVDQMVVRYRSDRADAEIERGIEQALKWNMYVDDALIDVTVSDGRVTLSGTVGSAAERALAKTIAWVAGVRAVDVEKLEVERWARDAELRGDKYDSKSAEEIRKAVKDALLYDPRVMSFQVDVEVSGQVVTLRGDVNNLKAKRAAEQDAQWTVGVASVRNRLKVRPDDVPTDHHVADQIRNAFERNPYVERFEISTVVVDGVAYLYGTVDSMFEKNQADDLAARVKGVVDVKNHLDVSDRGAYHYNAYVDHDAFVTRDDLITYERRSPYMTDEQIREAVESELWWSPFVDADEVTVVVRDGVVQLTGAVDSWSERRSATENAYEGGATLVENDLMVESG